MSFSFDNYCKAVRVTTKGRSTRSEYWSFFGFSWIYFIILVVLMALVDDALPKVFGKILFWVFVLFFIYTAVVHFCVMVRRLHDTGKSGWWAGSYYILVFLSKLASVNAASADFYSIVIFVFWIVMMVFLCTKSDPLTNKYGECPLPKSPVPKQPTTE